jgi:murein DD-endopeptidase MepM/ murein hydrolase activator NlpD
VQGDFGLEQARLRGEYRLRAGPDPIELGNEPPLSVDGESNHLVDRRRISVQWFSGTILTGLCGAALMGGAVFASLDGESHFASLPERVESALRGAIGVGEKASAARKADKLPPPSETNVARQIIRVSTMTKAGQREVVRVRPFVRVAGNLSLTVSDLSANIPPFNPQRMLAEATPGGAVSSEDAADAAAPDAEVSFVTRDLAGQLPRLKVAALLPMDDVIARVRDTANWTGNRTAVAGIQPSYKLAYAAEGTPDPYAGFEARIVPENITLLPKTAAQTGGNTGWNEKNIILKKGESVPSILKELNATPNEIAAITGALGGRGKEGALKEGQRVRVLLSPTTGGRLQPVRVIVLGDSAVEAAVALSDLGKYVAIDVRNVDTVAAEPSEDEEDDGTGVRLYQAIYETALRNQVPRPVIEDMVRVYSYDVDFQRKVQPGDSFEVLFAGEEESPSPETRNDVLFASLTVGGETKKFYRFQTPDDNVVDYYDETGKSAKKFLIRKPSVVGIMRSGFGGRRHPILGYSKMHTGVDWAAPFGTPIFAAGNGVVEKVGWEGGYGKYVRLKHNNGYETAYGHMSAFARGIEAGKRVRQGQVIGFVGSTGLSTGAHVHYEILVNGRFVDPMRIKLPRGRALEGPVIASFEKERDRLDGMMKMPASSRVAQTAGAAQGAGK